MARIDFGPAPLCLPQPVFIVAAYDGQDTPCAMNAAWGGISDTHEISLCLSHTHKTVANLLLSKAFTISMADAAHIAACDYVGIASGNDVSDKFAHAGFTATCSAHVHAPVINELPVCLECELVSYNPATGHLVGRIANVSVDEAATTDGKVDVAKMQPLVFDPFNKNYHVVGQVAGKAWDCGKELM